MFNSDNAMSVSTSSAGISRVALPNKRSFFRRLLAGLAKSFILYLRKALLLMTGFLFSLALVLVGFAGIGLLITAVANYLGLDVMPADQTFWMGRLCVGSFAVLIGIVVGVFVNMTVSFFKTVSRAIPED
jgi:predicted benzoate:H+ symporter BenE